MIEGARILKKFRFNRFHFALKKLKRQSRNKADQSSKLLIQQKVEILEANMRLFVQQFEAHAELVQKSPSSFTSLFARSCLIANKYIPYQKYYPLIKKTINSENFQLSPHSCTSLVECFAQFKFEGDQNKLIQKLFKYYQENHQLFTQTEEATVWENYLKIMAQKAHSSIKFVPLKRKQFKTFEYSALEQIIKKSVRIDKLKRWSQKLTFESPNEANIKFQRKGRQIIFKIKGIDGFDKSSYNKVDQQEDKTIWNNIMKEIIYLNKRVKKNCHIFFYGKVSPEKQTGQKYIYIDKKPDGTHEQYIKTKKIEQKYELSESFFKCRQNIESLRLSKRYMKGIFYNSTSSGSKQIDLITTFILGIASNAKTFIRYLEMNKKQANQSSNIINFLTLDQLKQCYGYSKLCQFHWKLFQSFIEVQNHLNYKQNQEEQKYFEIDRIKKDLNNQLITNQQAQLLILTKTDEIAQMSVQSTNRIKKLRFSYEYNKDYKKIYQVIANYGSQLFWQMRPFYTDTLRIAEQIDHIIDKSQNNIKIVLLTEKQNVPHLIQNIIQLKFWTVPKLKNVNPQQTTAKQSLFSELILGTQKNHD